VKPTLETAPPALPSAAQVVPVLNATVVGLLAVGLAVYLLRTFATVLQQLLVAMLLAYLILPLHHALVRRGVPYLVSCVTILGGTLVAIVALGSLLYDSAGGVAAKLPDYQKNLVRMVRQVAERIPGVDGDALQKAIIRETPEVGQTVHMVLKAVGSVFGFTANAFVVLIYLVFLLAESSTFRLRLEKAYGHEQAGHVLTIIARINGSIAQYLAVKTAMGLVAGVFTTVLLLLFKVDYAPLWGVLAFLLNYIPYLGSIVAVILPVLLSLVQLADLGVTLLILLALLAMQNGIGYVIEPRIAGRKLDLSPLVILLALAFWGTLWGLVGMILAVPLVVVAKIVLENVPTTRPIAALLSNV
jgi:predicted PurR-regulated permease PerM